MLSIIGLNMGHALSNYLLVLFRLHAKHAQFANRDHHFCICSFVLHLKSQIPGDDVVDQSLWKPSLNDTAKGTARNHSIPNARSGCSKYMQNDLTNFFGWVSVPAVLYHVI